MQGALRKMAADIPGMSRSFFKRSRFGTILYRSRLSVRNTAAISLSENALFLCTRYAVRSSTLAGGFPVSQTFGYT